MHPRWVDRIWPAMVVVAGIVVVTALSVFAGPVFHTATRHQRTYTPAPQPGPSLHKFRPPKLPERPFALSIWVLAIIGAVLVIGSLIVALQLEIVQRITWFRRPSESVVPLPPDSTVERVLAAVDAGLAELDVDDSDPRGAVIECWVRLERVAFLTGVEQRADRTSSELVAQLLQYQRISESTLEHFAELYRTARYSKDTVGASMRDDARESFRQLRRELLLSFGAAK